VAIKRDYYDVLGLACIASEDEIKREYRRLAMKYHPDRNQGDADAEDKFKEVKEAYEVLIDPDKRRAYDEFGHSWQDIRGRPQRSTSGFTQTFTFSGTIGNTQFTIDPNGNILCMTLVPLRKLLQGGTHTIHYPSKVPSGPFERIAPVTREITLERDTPLYATIHIDLDNRKMLSVQTVPAQDSGFWEQDNGCIWTQIAINTMDAIVGGEVTVPHPAGSVLKIKIPPNTRDEALVRVRGKGMRRMDGVRSDFMVSVAHHTKTYTAEQLVILREAMQKIQREMNPDA